MNDNRKDNQAFPLQLFDAKRPAAPPLPARSKSAGVSRFLLPPPRLPPRPDPTATKRAPVPQLALVPKSPLVRPPAKSGVEQAAPVAQPQHESRQRDLAKGT